MRQPTIPPTPSPQDVLDRINATPEAERVEVLRDILFGVWYRANMSGYREGVSEAMDESPKPERNPYRA